MRACKYSVWGCSQQAHCYWKLHRADRTSFRRPFFLRRHNKLILLYHTPLSPVVWALWALHFITEYKAKVLLFMLFSYEQTVVFQACFLSFFFLEVIFCSHTGNFSFFFSVKATFSVPRQTNMFSKLYLTAVRNVGNFFGTPSDVERTLVWVICSFSLAVSVNS